MLETKYQKPLAVMLTPLVLAVCVLVCMLPVLLASAAGLSLYALAMSLSSGPLPLVLAFSAMALFCLFLARQSFNLMPEAAKSMGFQVRWLRTLFGRKK